MAASYIDLADATYLEFDYMRWIRLVLRVARARRVLHLGGGACALARALAAEDPEGRQEVCESDAEVLALGREHLGLRRAPGLRVRHAEGRAFLADQSDATWDAIVIDAFVGARVPRHLVTVQAMTECARVAPLVLVNVVDDRAARVVADVGAAVSDAYSLAWTFGVRGANTVVAGSMARLDFDRLAARLAGDVMPARLTEPETLERSVDAILPWRDEEL